MLDVLLLVLSAVIGMALGGFYFGVLYLTARSLPTMRWPALMTAGALLFRFAVVIWIIAIIAIRWGWPEVLAVLAGFVLARIVLMRRWAPRAPRV